MEVVFGGRRGEMETGMGGVEWGEEHMAWVRLVEYIYPLSILLFFLSFSIFVLWDILLVV